ncbi:hypothetical protein COY07_03315 [Candidatus Peregrinibacteria bacterium CG_4_10_14_0_2_um_filter_43_11]|nr:MAG: hypothetical protein COY07_03315 [Candidatus Peregrinibacteria bacterium CG_4_10_14_0_2_um_filter_43_11]
MDDIDLNHLPYEPIPPKKWNPFYRFIAFVLALGLLLLSWQGYFYLIHPEPLSVVQLADIQSFLPDHPITPFTSHAPERIKVVLSETESELKQIANVIATRSCKKADNLCYSKALFYFVRDQIRYVPDPRFDDRLENPITTLKTGGADCEDMAVLLAGLQKAIGNDAKLVFIPGHVYAQVRIPSHRDKWFNMEATCGTCSFGELPTDLMLERKQFYNL